MTGIQVSIQAQDSLIIKPSWWFGAAAGANLNFYHGSTQNLNSDLTIPVAFHQGFGVGLYAAPLVEFHFPDSRWGIILQAGYDDREGKFNEVKTPCNCPADLSTDISYITVEPSLRFAPFKSDFYLFAGPRLAYNIENSFTYKLGLNPDYPTQIASPDIKGNLGNMNKTLISMQIGAGYDIPISLNNKQNQFVLSPFISIQPYYGQDPRSIETWNITTLRAGVTIKFGRGRVSPTPAEIVVPEIQFYVNAPNNIPLERRVRETFPLRNYVFFDLGSTEIPTRYVLLKKDQVKDFKENQLEVLTPKKLTGRSEREMIVYYNILNILGDRMFKNPSAKVRLSGSSMEGLEDGKTMAETIKRYLVNTFGIDTSRIITEGRINPRKPSAQSGQTHDLALLRESDHRVSIWSTSPDLMMEFQSGPEAPLKPVEIIAIQEAPLDSYVSFNVKGSQEAFSSWSLEIKDEEGSIQHFGPYDKEQVNLPGKSILGAKPEGNFKVMMIGNAKNGRTVIKDTTLHMTLWVPSQREEGMRFSVIFEFNESKVINIYEKYLTEIIIPKIPAGGTVIIHGHTDIIGDVYYNQRLSLARANDVKSILQTGLSKAGRNDVKFKVFGFGADQNLAPFENNLPEERFYNRTVIIDIIPNK